jgi:hypothetical protein
MQLTTTQPTTVVAPKKETLKSFVDPLKKFQKALIEAFAHRNELQAHQFVNGSDMMWYAFDPTTGQCVYADSEAELRIWIEENYQGK